MSFLQTLEMHLFTDNVRWVSINIGQVTHTIPMDTILNCPRSLKISSMILHYCATKNENPEKASLIFGNRDGQLFSHILHFSDTQHLVYPSDLDLTKTLVRDLCCYGLIRIKDGYCHQCLMDYFKHNGLEDFRTNGSDEKDRNSSYRFLHLTPETVIIQSENAGGEIFALRAWGTPRTLEEMFPKGKLENDSAYFQLSMRVEVIHIDLCQFLKQIAETLCCVVKKLGFRATCYSTWSDESRVVHYGQWILYRQLPAIKPSVSSITSITSRAPSLPPAPDGSFETPQPKLKKRNKWCPCLAKKDSVDIPMEYPDLPPKKASAGGVKPQPKTSDGELKPQPKTSDAELKPQAKTSHAEVQFKPSRPSIVEVNS